MEVSVPVGSLSVLRSTWRLLAGFPSALLGAHNLDITAFIVVKLFLASVAPLVFCGGSCQQPSDSGHFSFALGDLQVTPGPTSSSNLTGGKASSSSSTALDKENVQTYLNTVITESEKGNCSCIRHHLTVEIFSSITEEVFGTCLHFGGEAATKVFGLFHRLAFDLGIVVQYLYYHCCPFEVMAQSASQGGTIPLTEYRREVPPGWGPNIQDYPLKNYFEKLRLWYRVFDGADEVVGPLVAGRLVGRAQKLAINLKLPRPHDNGFDVGDDALVRLSVEEVRDPMNPNNIIQHHIPSGVQALCNALRDAFGQSDQDMVSRSLESFFEFRRGKMSLQEYSVEWDLRYDEAETRSNLQLNEVAKFYLFFKHSGLPSKFIEDVKLQIQGDLNRFSEARALALRLSQRSDATLDGDHYYGEQQEGHEDWQEEWPEEYYDAWSENYYGDEDYEQFWMDEEDAWYDYEEEPWLDNEEYWQEESGHQEAAGSSSLYPDNEATNDGQSQEDYYKGKGKNSSKNAMGLGCHTCGSKWHSTKSCPVNAGGKMNHYGGKPFNKSYGKGKYPRYGKSKGYPKGSWYPRRFGKGKGFGKSYGGFGGKGKGKGKARYYADMEQYYVHGSRGSLNISDVKQEFPSTSSTTRPKNTTTYHRMDSMDDILSRNKNYHQQNSETDEVKTDKQSNKVLNFAMFLEGSRQNASYHTIRGEKRRGLLIDPGAASGLIGSETLRDLIDHCIPSDRCHEAVKWSAKKTSVAGISGESDETLGEVSIKLQTADRVISYRGDVLGGAGSLCPALVGNPTLRQQQAALFSDWFPNGDGLLSIHRAEMLGPDQQPIMLRLLLTDSGHYLLPTDGKNNNQVSEETSSKVSFLTKSLVEQSMKQWPNEPPQLRHCFHTLNHTKTDRSEDEVPSEDASQVLRNVGADHSGDIGRGTCQLDRCYPMTPMPGCETLTGKTKKKVSFSDKELKGEQGHEVKAMLTQPIERKEDIWVIDGKWLIREHHMSRRTMYTPNCSKTTPVEIQDITGVRRTEIHYLPTAGYPEGETHVIEDDWKDAHVAHQDLERPWKGKTMFLIHDHLEEYWQNRKDLETWLPHYFGDRFPDFDENKIRELYHEYKAMPEEFYTKSGKRPVTPDNVDQWLREVRKQHNNPSWHFVELFSGSGRLSLTMATAGLSVGFPVDLRYGWDINNYDHQNKLLKVFDVMKPGVIFASPRCKFHSTTSNTMDPEKKALGRQEDEPGLEFLKKLCQQQANHGRGYCNEQPLGSTMWTDSPMKPEELPGCRNKQRCDQCMHGCCDESQQPIQKATGFMSNFKLRRTCKRCSGHKGRPHSHLQGKIGGINRTAKAAVYPKAMCQELTKDIISYLGENKLLKSSPWPRSLQHVWHSHLYKCMRCQMGRAAPSFIEHSLVPGECRHGVYPTADGKRPKVTPANPIDDWKKKARLNPLTDAQLDLPKSVQLNAEQTVYWKAALLQLVQDALAVIEEATKAGAESSHWVTDPTLLSVVQELMKEMMTLKGIRVCLRPWHMATPTPQLTLKTTPLRIQIQGTVKHWIMEEMEDLTTYSPSQIGRAIDIDDWQVTFFGSEPHLEKKKKGQPTTPGSQPATPGFQPSGTSSSSAAPGTPAVQPAPGTPVRPSVNREDQPQQQQAEPSEQPQQPEGEAQQDDDEERHEEATEVFRPRNIVSQKPLYDFRKVFQRLPQLAVGNPQTAIRLLLGLHEKYWHAPPHDLRNLLARAGMPVEVINLVGDAVMKCEICRRYVRLPNRPQHKLNNAGTFNQCLQLDLFKIWGSWVLLIVDEATRYKVATLTDSREATEIQQHLLDHWMRYFGPPASIVMDQEASVMSHETAVEFERLNIERKPKGTTAGAAAQQHTGTGLVERHVGLLRLTMMKLKAELERQGISHDTAEIAMESAMAHNSTLNYGGVTPAMAVFGILPRGFYDDESVGIMASAGALQTDLTVFEKALRVRQLSLSAVQQAIVEDRTARANRTRSHRLDTASLVPGTTEVDLYREVQGDVGWRGPALLLKLDADEGVAIVEYRGRPYLVAIRHIRPHARTFNVEQRSLKLSDQSEDELFVLMKMTESLPPLSKRMIGFILEYKVTGMAWRQTPSLEHFNEQMFEKAKVVSRSLTERELSGMVYGRSLKFIKPPKDTTGYIITWMVGSLKYGITEHWNDTSIKSKKITNQPEEELCCIYLYYYVANQEEETTEAWRRSSTSNQVPESMSISGDVNSSMRSSTSTSDARQTPTEMSSIEDDINESSLKRDGPESRTVVLAPEIKRQRCEYWSSHLEEYNASSLHYLLDRRKIVKSELPNQWHGTQQWADNESTEKWFNADNHYQDKMIKSKGDFLFHIGAGQDAILHVDVRTSEVWRVDTEHDDINEEDVAKIWPLVDEADKNEVEQFVQEQAFKKIHRLEITEDMVVIDARWVRKWKKLADGKKKVKSRLCARGCLDKQKSLLTTRSTTATRLSQRLLLSVAAVFDMEVESWDIAGAFLKGLNFNQIRDMLRDMGVNSPVRQVIIVPPMNTWRHLASFSSHFKVSNPSDWALLCLKPIYGLNDAPLAWQLSLHNYLREINAVPSHMDENSWRWKDSEGKLLALCTCHVDDVAIAGPKKWLEHHYQAFVKKFKKVTRQQLPFEHCGARYEKVGDGYRMNQAEFCSKMKAVDIEAQRKDNDKLLPEEVTQYRSILGALLWLTATRLDLVSEVSQLASFVTTAEIKHLRLANQLLKRAQHDDYQDVGIYFMKLNPSRGLRLACFHDSSSFTKEKAYAHEGVMVLLMEDNIKTTEGEYEKTCDDFMAMKHGGRAHILWSHGAKAKRISYSTSHAETLAGISGVEASVMVNVRISELLHPDAQPSLQQLAAIQEIGNPQLPIDDYGDCNDVYQLVTMNKTLPQDKTQRIYILSLRESRLSGRIRWMCLVPTQSMVADAFTKPMHSLQLLKLLTSGIMDIKNEETHHVQMKRLPPKFEIEERDLSTDDNQLIDQYKKEVKKEYNMWWTPMIAAAATGRIPWAATMVLCCLPGAAAVEEKTSEDGTEDRFGYLIPFFVLMVVILMTERMAMSALRRFGEWIWPTSASTSTYAAAIYDKEVQTAAAIYDKEIQTAAAIDEKSIQVSPISDARSSQVSDGQAEFETKRRMLETELRQARDAITKLNLQHEKHVRDLIEERRSWQQKYELLKTSVESRGQSSDTSHLEIPSHVFVTPNGESFHRENCPSLQIHRTPRPQKKLAKCLRCF